MSRACKRDVPVSGPDLSIGPLRLKGRVLLAPMAGITDAGMRRVARESGASLTYTEMVAAEGYARGDLESRARAERPDQGLHAVQIAGCTAASLAAAAAMAEAAGADLIDINMGCPAKRVTGGYAGSALMRDLDHAAILIRATVAAVTIPVTVKMRLGWDAARLNAPELARRAEAEGASLVTVHGRTRSQFYTGAADWHAVRAVKDAVRIPIVVNGDCRSAADARGMLAASNADGVMIGRAAVGRPWIVGDIVREFAGGKPGDGWSRPRRHAAARDHYLSLLDAFGREKGMRHARKHLAAYAEHAVAAKDLASWRRDLVTSEDPAKVLQLLEQVFSLSGDSEGGGCRARAA